MPPKLKPKIVVVLGPTASGKSDLAVMLARRMNGEVISADSRQVYRGLDLGSGKITAKEMRGVRHHLLDVASPRGIFTVTRYQTLARRAAQEILKRGKVPIVAGGTGMYIDALLYGTSLPPVPPDRVLRATLESQSPTELFAQLAKLDPARARTIDRHNMRRLVRALEIVLKTGRPVPGISARTARYDTIKIGMSVPPDELKRRIKTRLAKRLRQGMLQEVAALHRGGLSWKRLDGLGLEYRYASRHLRGLLSRAEMIRLIESESWKYARRQMTWWRKDKEIHWVKTQKEALRLLHLN